MYAISEAFDFMGDYLVELSKKRIFKKIGSYDEKCFNESKTKQLKQFDHEKRAFLIMSRTEKQMKKQY